MRTLKERITDLESQIELLDKQISSKGPDSVESQKVVLDGKIVVMRQKLETLEFQRSLLDSKDSGQDARTIKRERLMNQLKSLQESYLNYLESIGRAPGTEGKDALDLIK